MKEKIRHLIDAVIFTGLFDYNHVLSWRGISRLVYISYLQIRLNLSLVSTSIRCSCLLRQ